MYTRSTVLLVGYFVTTAWDNDDKAQSASTEYASVKPLCYLFSYVIEGRVEVKLPTICRDGKAEVGRVRQEKSRSEKIREETEWEARRCRRAKR